VGLCVDWRVVVTGRVVVAPTILVTWVVLFVISGRVGLGGGCVVVGGGGRVVVAGGLVVGVGVGSGMGSSWTCGGGSSGIGGGGGGTSKTGSGVGGCVSSRSVTSTVNSIGISSSVGRRHPPVKPPTNDTTIRPTRATMCPISESFIPEAGWVYVGGLGMI